MGNYPVVKVTVTDVTGMRNQKKGKGNKMDKKSTDVVAYFTIFGWVAAYAAGDREASRFHLNQGLVINLTLIILTMLTRVPVIGIMAYVLEFAAVMFWIMGILYAVREQESEIPLLGGIRLLK